LVYGCRQLLQDCTSSACLARLTHGGVAQLLTPQGLPPDMELTQVAEQLCGEPSSGGQSL
jgi:hypothetical protein